MTKILCWLFGHRWTTDPLRYEPVRMFHPVCRRCGKQGSFYDDIVEPAERYDPPSPFSPELQDRIRRTNEMGEALKRKAESLTIRTNETDANTEEIAMK